MSSSAPLVKAALVEVCTSLFTTSTAVVYGTPGAHRPDEIVSVMGQRTVNDRGPMSPQRARDEVVETVVIFSVYRPGDNTVQQAATERAYALLDELVDYLRVAPHETLGIAGCRDTRVTEHELEENVIYNAQNKPTGRSSMVAAVVTSTTRV